MVKRVALIVMDSLGVGALPDAEQYGDAGSNTLGHICSTVGKLTVPHLEALGFGAIDEVKCLSVPEPIIGSYGRLKERSKGKDTITGHWEIAGLYTAVPFKTYPHFPADFMERYEKAVGRGTLGNVAASGTEIIKILGEEQKKTGKLIVYTSSDSVFQIAANTAVIPLEELYRCCEIAREMLVGDLQVGRVIARPFVEEQGVYTRTSDRKDYAVPPTGTTLLDLVSQAGQTVYSVGKIRDIFNGRGVTQAVHTVDNMDGVDQTILALKQDFEGLIFTNLVDFDSKFGHRRNPAGYANAIEELDRRVPQIMEAMKDSDVIMFCADHGNDPTHSGWDHTREAIPLLIYGKEIQQGINLGTRDSFADIGATVAALLHVGKTEIGESFAAQILK